MLWLLVACSAGEPNEGALLTGWWYGWRDLSHRISYLRVGVQPDTSLDLGLIGGTWTTGEDSTDVPDYRVRYEHVRTRFADFAQGSAELEVGPDGVASGEIGIAGLPERGELAVV